MIMYNIAEYNETVFVSNVYIRSLAHTDMCDVYIQMIVTGLGIIALLRIAPVSIYCSLLCSSKSEL